MSHIDAIKKTTGETANHYIKQYIIQLGKNRLVSGLNSYGVAYSLGFEYTHHISLTFKNITGETPTQYCESRLNK